MTVVTGPLSTTSLLAPASRTALAAVDCSAFSEGVIANVVDLGDGQPATFVLRQDARSADGVLRISATNRSGYLWIAGDGVTLARTYLSGLIDFKSTVTGAAFFGGSAGGADLLFQTGPTIRILVTQFAATAASPVTTAMTWNAGNDASKTNLGPSQAVPTTTGWNNMITAGVSAPMMNAVNPNVSSLKTLNNQFKIDITVAAAGANLTTLKGKFLAFGWVMATTTAV
jgi:hypothetical protein